MAMAIKKQQMWRDLSKSGLCRAIGIV